MKDMADNLTIGEITKEEADRWLKYLYDSGGELLENLHKAFHEEKNSNPPKALPPEKRKYYMVYANRSEELLAGINTDNLNISSLAKVITKGESKARGRDCIRKLIEEIVVIECRNAHKKYFCVRTNDEGEGVFKYLMTNLPKGIIKIDCREKQNGYYPFILHIDSKG